MSRELTIYRDFYAYDVNSDEWTVLNDFPGEARVAGTQFSANGKGYILSGDGDNHGPLDYGEFWEYNPGMDSWTELAPHPGGARWAPGSFVQGCYAYLTGGMEGTAVPFPIYHHDLWRVSLIDDCGCTDMNAVNFDSTANTDDGTCCYVAGCMDVTAVNYNEDACLSDGSCQDAILGCTDPESVDFDPAANTEVATGGPIDFSELGSGGFHYNDSWDMEFSVFEPTVLKSVEVFAQDDFTIDVYVKNTFGVTLAQNPFSLAAGWNTLELTWTCLKALISQSALKVKTWGYIETTPSLTMHIRSLLLTASTSQETPPIRQKNIFTISTGGLWSRSVQRYRQLLNPLKTGCFIPIQIALVYYGFTDCKQAACVRYFQ